MGMQEVSSDGFLNGRVLVCVPHMDDAVLGCGGVLASVSDKSAVRLVYCTDGRGSMRPEERETLLGSEKDIGLIRQKETFAALDKLGYQKNQIEFLGYEEWKLPQSGDELCRQLSETIREFEPAVILVPSRYDKHCDHLALNRALLRAVESTQSKADVFEYFVYYQWKLLLSGDIRDYIRSELLVSVDISSVSELKREALDCFESQTTVYYDWQHKPVLSAELLERFAAGPEIFMRVKPEMRERDILRISPMLVHTLNRLEPFLKNTKEKILSIKHCKFCR
jgi:LmbE family N-acetylglucosaminyl deacetylase